MYHPIRVQSARLSRVDLRGMVRMWIPFCDDSTQIFKHPQKLERFYVCRDQGPYVLRTNNEYCRRVVLLIQDLVDDPCLMFGQLSLGHINMSRAELLRLIDEVLYGIQP
jgi:hypothetical protein